MSVAAHALEIGKTYKLGYGEEFTVESVDLEPKRLELNRKPRFYYYTTDGRQVVSIAGEMYTEMPPRPQGLNLSWSNGPSYGGPSYGGPSYGRKGGRRRKSRKARRAQKKRTRRSRR